MAPLKLWNIHITTYHLFWDTPKLEKSITKYNWLALKLSPTKIRGTVSSSAPSIKSYVKGQTTAHHFRVSGVRGEGVELSSSFPQSQCMTTVQKIFTISPGHTGHRESNLLTSATSSWKILVIWKHILASKWRHERGRWRKADKGKQR